jgi:hypothetical protein
MRPPRHRPIRWPVFFDRQPTCHPVRRTPTADTSAHVHDVTQVCPTCGSTFVEELPDDAPPD